MTLFRVKLENEWESRQLARLQWSTGETEKELRASGTLVMPTSEWKELSDWLTQGFGGVKMSMDGLLYTWEKRPPPIIQPRHPAEELLEQLIFWERSMAGWNAKTWERVRRYVDEMRCWEHNQEQDAAAKGGAP